MFKEGKGVVGGDVCVAQLTAFSHQIEKVEVWKRGLLGEMFV
jgi:hypothetical protein